MSSWNARTNARASPANAVIRKSVSDYLKYPHVSLPSPRATAELLVAQATSEPALDAGPQLPFAATNNNVVRIQS
jgi:hypothetical protein